MKAYFSAIIPKIKQYSKKLDNLTWLINQRWVIIDDKKNIKQIYIFFKNGRLLISTNGKVEKTRWEYIDNNSLLIYLKNGSYLFKHGFIDENILALKIDSKDEYVIFINETKSSIGDINSVADILLFLQSKSINNNIYQSFIRAIHVTQAHDIIETKKINKFIFFKKNAITVEFKDEFIGIVYEFYGEFYIKLKPYKYWFNIHYVYSNFDYCINALYQYHKSKKILSEGFEMRF